MASAVLDSQQNKSNWAAHMGKIPYSGSYLKSNPNPNPISNPKKKQKKFHQVPAAVNGLVPAARYYSNNNNNNHYVESPAAVTQTASDDAYSYNQTSTSRPAVGSYGEYLTFNISSYTKSELMELRKRLYGELEQIRDLRDRVESGEANAVGNPRSQPKLKKIPGNSKRPGPAGFGSVVKRPSNGFENGGSLEPVNFEGLLKECGKIVAKLLKHKFGYIFKAPVDAAALGLHDYHQIVRRPMDLGTVKTNLARNLYSTPGEFAADVKLTFNNALLYNPKTDPVNGMAEQLLSKFEEMYRPIQEKIDSGFNQRSEKEFREYRVNKDNDEIAFRGNEDLQGSSWNSHHSNLLLPSPMREKKSKPRVSPVPLVSKKPERIVERMQQMPVHQAHSSASTPSNPPPPSNHHALMQEQLQPSPVRVPPQPMKEQKVMPRVGTVKQPKPRAKDPNKRDMSMEEKQKLGLGLQNLPQEKMPQLVQIIRKRNDQLAADGDEIELDIEALDTETLWELDRFVTNWKKMVSKTKRQELMLNPNQSAGLDAPSSPTADADMDEMSDKNNDSVKKVKDMDDEDLDIDDDMPATNFPPVEIEKDEGAGVGGGQDHDPVPEGQGNASSSSSSSGSSSSDDSSSSDSDSGSSSGSDSDADDAQS